MSTWTRVRFGVVSVLLAAGTFAATSPADARPRSIYYWDVMKSSTHTCDFYYTHRMNLNDYPVAITNPVSSGCYGTSDAWLTSSLPSPEIAGRK